jgi:hypothetical protein
MREDDLREEALHREKTTADRVTAFPGAVLAVMVTLIVREVHDFFLPGPCPTVKKSQHPCFTRAARSFTSTPVAPVIIAGDALAIYRRVTWPTASSTEREQPFSAAC